MGYLGALLYSELYLAMGEYDEAFRYISMAKSLIPYRYIFSYEIRLRLLETIYFAYTSDYEFVRRLSLNIRYIQLQKLSLKQYNSMHIFLPDERFQFVTEKLSQSFISQDY